MTGEAGAESAPRRAGAAAAAARMLTLLLTGFVLFEVNRPAFSPQTGLAVFGLLGLPLSFLARRASPGGPLWRRVVDGVGLASAAAGCAWVLWWSGFAESTLGDRAGGETDADIVFGLLGLLGVLIAAWRALGPALPILTGLFVLHASLGPSLPDFLFPHRGYPLSRIASQGFLHTQGVFGIALRVMFAYVFLFVVFGAVLQETGAIRFITASSRRLFRGTVGGAAKVSVFANALMGSLSGSAVADAATTGSFTIPMMRSTGFSARLAAGITAAASSGAALVPPVMGAGAYMMLELVDPPVRYLEVIRAAVLPAILYYAALLLTVHLSVRRRPLAAPPAPSAGSADDDRPPLPAALVFGAGFASLLGALLAGRTVFRAVSIALAVVVVASLFHPDTRPRLRSLAAALDRIARGAAPLVAAAAAVGVILGMVTLTGVGTRFPAAILSVADGSLLPALLLIMVGSVVLGMGLPSAVCYLLMVTLIRPGDRPARRPPPLRPLLHLLLRDDVHGDPAGRPRRLHHRGNRRHADPPGGDHRLPLRARRIRAPLLLRVPPGTAAPPRRRPRPAGRGRRRRPRPRRRRGPLRPGSPASASALSARPSAPCRSSPPPFSSGRRTAGHSSP